MGDGVWVDKLAILKSLTLFPCLLKLSGIQESANPERELSGSYQQQDNSKKGPQVFHNPELRLQAEAIRLLRTVTDPETHARMMYHVTNCPQCRERIEVVNFRDTGDTRRILG